MPLNGVAITAIIGGGVVAYSGLKGGTISTNLRAFLSGQRPVAANGGPIGIVATGSGTGTDPGVGTGAGSNVVTSAAVSQLGKPYVWDTPQDFNDPNPQSFDCSGLTGWCYAKGGVKLSHFTGSQFLQLKHRPLADAQPGDLVFFGTPVPYHVAIYMGGGRIIEAPDVGIPVRYRNINGNTSGIRNIVGIYPGGA